jgi:hypothetical protein
MLPGGGKVGVYQPRHARPKPMKARGAKMKATKRASNKKTARGTARKSKGKRRRS